MSAQFRANDAAVRSVTARFYEYRFLVFASAAVMAFALGGCTKATGPLAGADPADTNSRVAGVGYRSTIAPYTSLRPTVPTSWREQNDRAAPNPKSGQ